MQAALRDQSAQFTKARPEVRPGFTVRVHERIKEGDKERTQIFEGLVIAVHKGMNPTDSTITVRRIASGVGVEKIFPLHSPNIEKIEVKKVAKVRRSKLFFLRGLTGKAARLRERFTTAGEFAVAIADPVEEVVEEEEIAEAEASNEDKAEEATDAKEEAATEPAEEKTEEKVEEAPKEESAEEATTEKKEEEKKEE